jgi:hypothetical protein
MEECNFFQNIIFFTAMMLFFIYEHRSINKENLFLFIILYFISIFIFTILYFLGYEPRIYEYFNYL